MKKRYMDLSKFLGKPLDLSEATSYFDAGDKLMEKLDLSMVQQDSFNKFLTESIPYYLNSTYENNSYSISFSDWWIDKSGLYSEDYCRKNKVSLEVALMATANIEIKKYSASSIELHPHVISQPVLITKFPVLTKKGNLIINGIEKILVSHLEPSNEIRLEEVKAKVARGQRKLNFNTATRVRAGSNTDTRAQTFGIAKVKKDKTEKIRANVGGNYYSVVEVLESYVQGVSTQLRDIVGTSGDFLSEISNIGSASSGTNGNIITDLSNFLLRHGERQCLNARLSLERRALGRKLAKPVVGLDGVEIASVGEIVTDELARYCQSVGIDLYVTSLTKIPIPVKIIHNRFCRAEDVYINKLHLTENDVPDIIKGVEINTDVFDNIYNESLEKDLDLAYLLHTEYNQLVGHSLTMEDFISMVNLYGQFLSHNEEEDDADSLTCKSIVNICEIYEEELSKMFPTKINVQKDDNSGLLAKINIGMLKFKQSQGQSESNTVIDKFGKLTLNLDCGPAETITSRIKSKSLINLEDTTSPLSQANHRRKVSLLEADNRKGVPTTSSDTSPRSVNPSYAGRFDCVESPEGAHIGLIRYLATFARINAYGVIEAPFFTIDKEKKVINFKKCYYLGYAKEVKYTRAMSPIVCKKSEVYMEFRDNGGNRVHEEHMPVTYIEGTLKPNDGIDYDELAQEIKERCNASSYNIIYRKKDWFENENEIYCSIGHGDLQTVDYTKVDLVTVRDEHMFSPVTATIPFVQNDDSARQMMAAHHGKQGINCKGSNKAYTKTEMADKISSTATGVFKSPVSGIVESVDSTRIVILSVMGERVEVELLRNFKTVEETLLYSIPIVKPGDCVVEGQVIADNNMTRDGELGFGANILVGYLPFYGLNFEDSVGFSDRMISDDVLTSLHIKEKEIKVETNTMIRVNSTDVLPKHRLLDKNDSKLLRQVPCSEEILRDTAHLDNNGIIKKGTTIEPGQCLMAYLRLATGTSRGSSSIYKIRKTIYQDFNPGVIVDTKVTESNQGTIVTIKIAYQEYIRPGDKISGRHGNKGVTSTIIPAYDMPYLANGRPLDILLTPLGVPSRMNLGQILEVGIGMLLKMYGLQATVSTMTKIDMEKFRDLISFHPYKVDKDGNELPYDPSKPLNPDEEIKYSDKVQLYDGYTGRPYEQRTFVGVMHCYKSKHQVSHKIFARLGGTYTVINQPPSGKKSGGGQKIGAMEIWSLAEMAANNVIDELMTFKTDDTSSRERLEIAKNNHKGDYGAMSKELEVMQKNTPYAYKMIDADLRSTLSKLVFLNEEGEEVDIYEDVVDSRGRVKDRLKEDTVKKRRKEAHDMLDNYIAIKKITADEASKYKLAPIEGYSEEYIKYGEVNTIKSLDNTDEYGELDFDMNGDVFEDIVEDTNDKDFNISDKETSVVVELNEVKTDDDTIIVETDNSDDLSSEEDDVEDEYTDIKTSNPEINIEDEQDGTKEEVFEGDNGEEIVVI